MKNEVQKRINNLYHADLTWKNVYGDQVWKLVGLWLLIILLYGIGIWLFVSINTEQSWFKILIGIIFVLSATYCLYPTIYLCFAISDSTKLATPYRLWLKKHYYNKLNNAYDCNCYLYATSEVCALDYLYYLKKDKENDVK